jgi:hypothetical protein
MSAPTIRARARSREDRAGDPLDGLVNLFDLGIVLSLAFLLAALSSLDLTDEVLKRSKPAQDRDRAPERSIVVRRDAPVRTIEVRPGERVVGSGEVLGTVYRLDDGRTVIVPADGADLDAAGGSSGGASGAAEGASGGAAGGASGAAGGAATSGGGAGGATSPPGGEAGAGRP